MVEVSIGLIASAFLAGVLMFLAPCTLPLVPAFLAFISGAAPGVQSVDHKKKIIINTLYYCLGFSLVFIFFGVLAGYFGTLAGSLRGVLTPLAGVLIILFGLQLLHVISLQRFFMSQGFVPPKALTPGSAMSALVIGGAFALGWTPCVGPILATILLLASSSTTALSGGVLLAIFSLGLAIPFLLTATLYSQATHFLATHQGYLKITELIGGVFLLIIGVLLLTDNFELTVLYGYKLLELVGIGNLLDYY